MTRLTRAESQARTREQLLATARDLFLRDGYLATSLDKVADTAGFSKGAVYSNFRNKDQLCLAVLDEIRAERAAEVGALLTAPTVEDRLRRFEEWAERVIGDPQWTALEFEFAVQARRDPVLRQELATRLAAVGEVVRSAVTGLMTNEHADEAVSRDAVTSRHADNATSRDATTNERADNAANRNPTTSEHAGHATNRAATTSERGNNAVNRDAVTNEHADNAVSWGAVGESAGRGQPPMGADEAAVALLCLGVGLGLFRSIEPGMPVSALVSTLRVLAGLPARG